MAVSFGKRRGLGNSSSRKSSGPLPSGSGFGSGSGSGSGSGGTSGGTSELDARCNLLRRRLTGVTCSAYAELLEEERQRETWARQSEGSKRGQGPTQRADQGKPRVYIEVAIFRGSFFGADHQAVLEFELHPRAAPEATRRVLEACAAGKLKDQALCKFFGDAVALPGLVLEPESGELWELAKQANLGKGRSATTGSVLLTLRPSPELVSKRVVFGRLLRGKEFLEKITGCQSTDCGREARIIACGEVAVEATDAGGERREISPQVSRAQSREGEEPSRKSESERGRDRDRERHRSRSR
ncbi:unnamed protein product [Polarella glacialis]|uniref:Uncharacterized protein n=1 Tax=Polarella glacialis TaxID=89957 RepID=A0A813K6G9_POLGL|nr:unnamed protein product [Polarella glacialis]